MPGTLKLDRLDIRILCQLQKNGRITNVDLADVVGLSPSPCLMRVKRLEKAGYIAAYGAQLRLDKLADTLLVFTEVTLGDHRREDFDRFEHAIRDIDEIIECHLVSGGYDYLLKFVTRGVNHYQSIVEGLLERNIGIEKYFSYIVIKSVFVKPHYPIERLVAAPVVSERDMERTAPASVRFVRLGETQRDPIGLAIDGRNVSALAGDTVLTVLLANGLRVRDSEFGDGVRAGFCLMGACQDCWVRDIATDATGRRIRACTTMATAGMSIVTRAPGSTWAKT